MAQDLTAAVEALKKEVAGQADDEGLWFNAIYISEAYLQRHLRKLHEMIENLPCPKN